ncbi:MAG: hypothetical protein ACPIOQ_24300, partial [Promethearchaeia archaeon]
VFPPGERLRPVGKPGRCLRFAPTAGVAVDTASASSGVRKRKGSDDMCEAFEGVFNLQQLFAANGAAAASGRLFILDPKSGDDSFAVDFRLEPHALAQAVVPSSTPLPADADAWAGRLQGLLDSFARPVLGESERFRDGESWEALVFAEAAEGFHRRALHLLQLASAGSDAGLQSRFLQAAAEAAGTCADVAGLQECGCGCREGVAPGSRARCAGAKRETGAFDASVFRTLPRG